MSNTFSSLEASSHKEQEGKGGTPQISPLPSSRTSQNKSQENGENRRNGEKFQDKLQDFRLAVAAALSAAALTLAPSPTAAESLPGSLVSTGVNGGTGVHSSGGSLTETLPAGEATLSGNGNRDIFLAPNITLKQSEFTPEMHKQLGDIYTHYFGNELKAIGFDLATALKTAFPPQSPAAGFTYQKIIADAQQRPVNRVLNAWLDSGEIKQSERTVLVDYKFTQIPDSELTRYPQFKGILFEVDSVFKTRGQVAQEGAMKVGVPLPTYQDVEQKLLPHIAASKQLLETLSNSFTLPSLQNGTALRDVQVNPEVQKAHAAYVKTSADGVKINTDMTGIHKQYIQDTIAYMRYTNNLRDTKVADAKKIADQFSTTVQVRLEQADQRLQATRASIEATRANNIKLGQEILMNAVTSIHNLMASWMKQNPPAPFNTTDVEEFLKINGSDLPTKRLQDAHYQISSDVKSHLIIGQIKDFSVFRNPSASNGDAGVKISRL